MRRNSFTTVGYRLRSTALIRSWSVSSVSPARTATASWARIGPSSPALRREVDGTAGELHPEGRARRARHGRRGRRVGAKGGCSVPAHRRHRTSTAEDGHEARHRHHVDVTVTEGTYQPGRVRRAVEVGTERRAPHEHRLDPRPRRPPSRARHARSATTRSTATPFASIDSRMVPLPEARTASRFTGFPTRGARCRYSASRSAAKGGSGMKRQPTVADIVMFVGGVITFIFSFLDFVSDFNAWSGDVFGLFPVTTLIAVLGLAMAVFDRPRDLRRVQTPDILTFTYRQMYVTWGIVAGGLMLCYLVMDKQGADTGAGLYLMLIGSLAMAVGAILNVLGLATQTVGTPAGTATAGRRGDARHHGSTAHGPAPAADAERPDAPAAPAAGLARAPRPHPPPPRT